MTSPLISRNKLMTTLLVSSISLAACGGGGGSSGGAVGMPGSNTENTVSDHSDQIDPTPDHSAGNSDGEDSQNNGSTQNAGQGQTGSGNTPPGNETTGSSGNAGNTGNSGNTGNTGSSGSTNNTGNSSSNSGSTNSGSTNTGNNDSSSQTSGGNPVTDNSSAGTDCQATVYQAGTAYELGDIVQNNQVLYQCDIAGWCSSGAGWAYAPGTGTAWQSAWHVTSSCSTTDNTADNSDSSTDDSADNVADNGNTNDSNTTDATAGTGNNSSSGSSSGTDTGNSSPSTPSTTDKVVGTYFVEWGIYGRNYHVNDIPAEKLTHILYGFIPICGPNDSLQQANPSGYSTLVSQCAGKPDYSVVVHDKFAALEKSYPGDKWDDPIRGNFGQFIKLKQQHPHLKILPSVGGWTLSDPFYYLANDPAKRAVFVNSLKDFIRQYDFFDGVDIDWEYPGGGGANAGLGSSADYNGYAVLMRDLRTMLDELETELGKELYLTSAVGAAPQKIAAVNYEQAQLYMDHIFLMSYDYHGAWNTALGHQTGLYYSDNNAEKDFYTQKGVDALLARNVPSEKIVVGVAMYGRGWSGIVNADPNNPFTGQGSTSSTWQGTSVNKVRGTWEDGVLDYKDIVQNYLGGTHGTGINGYQYGYDEQAEAPYLWNPASGSLITYDNPRSVQAKGQYVKQYNLGGLFSWEIDADNGDILDAMNDIMQ